MISRSFALLILAGWLEVATCVTALGQVSPFRAAAQVFIDPNGRLDYVAPLKTLGQRQWEFDADAYRQALATYSSFVGVASATADGLATLPATYKLAEAEPLLLAGARATSIVLINEAHTQPAHRAYCAGLLPLLRPLGYTCLALEALSPTDPDINTRGFPVAASGLFLCEPNMGKLVRRARDLKVTLVSYEVTAGQEREFTDWRRRSNYRDSIQALNLLAAMRRYPGAKLVALVGHDHILEQERDGLKRLATYLRELGQIDPLTIDQTTTVAGLSPNAAMTVVDDGGKSVTVGFNHAYVDLQVMHPPVALVQGRPSWLWDASPAPPLIVRLPRCYADRVCLVQLYDRAEYRQYGDKAVPLDQYLARPGQSPVVLFGGKKPRAMLVNYRLADL